MRKADITVWEGNILQISVPMSPPLRRVNSYLLPEKDGSYTIIDPGPRSIETESAWQGVLQGLGLSWEKLRNVVVTHHHPDHYGLAGWLQSRSGCKVWMSERAHAEATLMWGQDAAMKVSLPLFFARHGMPEGWTNQIRAHMESFETQVTPEPEVTWLRPSQPFLMGNREWLPVMTGGHAPGHLSFYHSGSGQMLCGDAVLPQISPNVSLLPGSDPQPLLTFTQGLQELRRYAVSTAFPGHREPFSGFAARIDSLLAHHEERLDTAEVLLAEGPASGFTVCEAMFRGRVSSVHQMRFAMSETLAHLVELVRRKRAVEVDHQGLIVYAAAR